MDAIQKEIQEIEKNLSGLGEQADMIKQIRSTIKAMEQKREFMAAEKEQARDRIDQVSFFSLSSYLLSPSGSPLFPL